MGPRARCSLRRVLGILLSAGLLLFAVTIMGLVRAEPASAGAFSKGQIGPAEWRSYCKSVGATDYKVTGHYAYGIACVNQNGAVVVGIDVMRLCHDLNKNTNSLAWVDQGKFYSDTPDYGVWSCVTVENTNPVSTLGNGRLDLNKFCQYMGDDGVIRPSSGQTVNDWWCSKSGARDVHINMGQACVYQSGRFGTFDFWDWYNPFSVACRY